MKKLSVEAKLGLDLFHTDEENSHIDVDLECTDEEEIRKLVLACPAECYKYIDGKFSFSYLGCLECRAAEFFLMTRLLRAGNIHMVKSVYLSDKVDRP